MSPDPDYALFTDQDLSRQMMPRIAVPNHEHWLAGDLALSGALKERISLIRDQRYGDGPRQVADLFPAARPGAPIVLFFHGGYWRALSKDHLGFVAGPLVQAGAACVVPGYDLCPSVSLRTVVTQAKQALLWTRQQAARLNGDPDRIYVAGNSAGAHIAAMMMAEDWTSHGLTRSPIAGAILVTGVYDLRAILRIQVNEEVRLAAEDVPALSPQFLPLHCRVPTIVAVGAAEPPLWIEQSRRFAAKLSAAGADVRLMEIPGLHHFSITQSLSDSTTPLTRAVLDLIH
ncbi:MAG TPA: alpha/beta hydrolase [Dongiaceae bacterium]|jgi:arylformamidase|nr:alpha/beta hydrolase [Dongiaceae bacterium]